MGQWLFPPPVIGCADSPNGHRLSYMPKGVRERTESSLREKLQMADLRFQNLPFEICNLLSRRARPRSETLRPEGPCDDGQEGLRGITEGEGRQWVPPEVVWQDARISLMPSFPRKRGSRRRWLDRRRSIF